MRARTSIAIPAALALLGGLWSCAPSRTEIVGRVPITPPEGNAGGGRPGASLPDAARLPPGGGGSGQAGAGGMTGSGSDPAGGGAGGTSGMAFRDAAAEARPPTPGAGADAAAAGRFRMMVFSKTAGYRHDSIASGLNMLRALGAANDFEIVPTEDAAQLSDATLEPYQVVFFLNTTDDILNATQQAAMERFVRGGKGFAAVHSAGDTEDGFGWAWYEELMGSTYIGHSGAGESGTIRIDPAAMTHPIIRAATARGLASTWQRNEEWYYFRRDVTGLPGVTVLLRATSPGLVGRGQGDWPHSWIRNWEGGRAFYIASGHAAPAFDEPLFREYVLQGILWAAGRLR